MPTYVKALSQLVEKESVNNLEINLEGKHRTLHVLLDVVTRRNAYGDVEEKRIILTDISARKKAEEDSRYLASLIDQTSDAIYSTDKSFTILSWNKGAEHIYGFPASEAITKDIAIVRSSISHVERMNVIEELQEKGFWTGELVHHRKDGTPINVSISVTVLRDQHGNVNGYVSVVQDITQRKLYEEKLRNFNNELIEKVNMKTQEIVNILERVTDGFLSIDKEYNITYVNNVAATLLERNKTELLGRNLSKIFSKEDNAFRQAYRKALETQKRIELEDYYDYFDRWYYSVMYPSPEGVSIFFRDVTKRK
jgi:PAS domain S-box-containing protein